MAVSTAELDLLISLRDQASAGLKTVSSVVQQTGASFEQTKAAAKAAGQQMAEQAQIVQANWQKSLTGVGAQTDRALEKIKVLGAQHPDLVAKSNLPALEAQATALQAELKRLSGQPLTIEGKANFAVLQAQAAALNRTIANTSTEVRSTAASMETAGTQSLSLADRLGKIGLAMMGLNAIKQGVEAGVRALEGFSQAAQDDEKDVASLDQAFKNAGLSITANSKQVQDLISANQRLGISDDATRDSLNTLVTKTGDYAKAVELQAVAIDLAAAKHISLETATRAVFRADDDSIGQLQKMGIEISKSATAEQNLAAIRAATAGQAAAQAGVMAGSVARVSDAASELGESLGYAINEVAAPGFKALADEMQSPEFQQGFQGFVDSVKEGAQNVGTALLWIKDQAQPVLQFLIDHADSTKVALVGMFVAIAGAATAAAIPIVASMAPVLLIMGTLAAGAFALSEAWNNDFLGMREAPMQVADLLLGSVTAMRGILIGLAQFLEPWVNAIGGAFQQLGAVISGHAVKAGEEFHVNLVAGVSSALDGAQAKLVALHQVFADFAVKPPVLGGEAGNGFSDALNTGMYHAIPETTEHMAQMAAILNSVVKPAGDSGAATGYEFISKLIGSVATGEPNVQAILTWLVENQGPKSALLWQALGVDNANIYAANLHAGLVAAALQEATNLKKLSDRVLNQMNGMGASYADALRAQSNAMIDSALADFKASIPDWQKIGILPKPPTPPKTPKGPAAPDLAAQARSAESAANTIISALEKAGEASTKVGATMAQALGPLDALLRTKLAPGFQFVADDYKRMLGEFDAGKLTMGDLTSTIEADLQKIAKGSDLSLAAMAQDALDTWHQQQAALKTSQDQANTQAAAALEQAAQSTLGSMDGLAREMVDPKRNPGQILLDMMTLGKSAAAANMPDIANLIAGYQQQIASGATVDYGAMAQALEASLNTMLTSSDPALAALALKYKTTWDQFVKDQADADQKLKDQAAATLEQLKETVLGTMSSIALAMQDPKHNTGTIMVGLLDLATKAADAGFADIANIADNYFQLIKSGANVNWTQMAQVIENALNQMISSSDPLIAALGQQYKDLWDKTLQDQKDADQKSQDEQNAHLEQLRQGALDTIGKMAAELVDPQRNVGTIMVGLLDLATQASAAGWPKIAAIASGAMSQIYDGAITNFDGTAQALENALREMADSSDPLISALATQWLFTWNKMKTDEADALVKMREDAAGGFEAIINDINDPKRNIGKTITDMLNLADAASKAGWASIADTARGYATDMLDGTSVDFQAMLDFYQGTIDQLIAATDDPRLKAALLGLKQTLAEAGTAAKTPATADPMQQLQWLKEIADPKFVLPSKERIAQVLASVRMVAQMFADEAEKAKAAASPLVEKAAADIDAIFGGLNTALQAVSLIGSKDIQQITPAQVDQALWVVDAALNRLAQIMDQAQFKNDFPAKAKVFAETLKTIFEALGEATAVGAVAGKGIDFTGLLNSVQQVLNSLGPVITQGFDPDGTDNIGFAWVQGWLALENNFRYVWSKKFVDEVLKPTLTDIRLAIQGEAAGFGEAGSMLGNAVINGIVAAIQAGKQAVQDATNSVIPGGGSPSGGGDLGLRGRFTGWEGPGRTYSTNSGPDWTQGAGTHYHGDIYLTVNSPNPDRAGRDVRRALEARGEA